MYKLKYTPDAEADLRKLKKSEPSAFKKAVHLLNELMEHPTTVQDILTNCQTTAQDNGLVLSAKNID